MIRRNPPMRSSNSCSSRTNSNITSKGKDDEVFGILNNYERTIVIKNIPNKFTKDDIEKAFSNVLFEQIHVPLDISDNPFGTAYIRFKSTSSCKAFLDNLAHPNTFAYFNNHLYTGPLSIEKMALPKTGSDDSSASLKITNSNCPDDETAIRIGQLYIDIKNKSEFDLNEKLEQIKISGKEKEKAHQELMKLREEIEEEQAKIDEVKQKHERKKRKLIEAEQEFEKKFR